MIPMNKLIVSLIVLFCMVSTAFAVVNPTGATHTNSNLMTCADGSKWLLVCPPGLEISGNTPVLFYSDLTSGPDNGWSSAEPNKGVAVTIWGTNLGANRGSSYVTVNGVNLDSNADYPDTWGEVNDPVPHLQRVTFHLKSSMTDGAGSISVTTENGTSNSLPFTIRSGRILFVDASIADNAGSGTLTDPLSPFDVFSGEQAGDTYYFRGGAYNQAYNTGKGNFYISGQTPGTESNPISLVGYPGEDAIMDTYSGNIGSNNFRYAFSTVPAYYTIARLKFNCYSECIRSTDYGRVVGNDVEGQKVVDTGAAHIIAQDDGVLVIGNSVHGGEIGITGNDHAIYAQGCPNVAGSTITHNYIHNNDFYNDAMIVVNHQQNRCSNSEQVKSHYISSNIIDCSAFGGRAIGVYDLSWDDSTVPGSDGQDTAGEPEPTYVYNNISYRCGDSLATPNGYGPSMYANGAHSRWFNNLILEANTDMGFHVDGGRLLSTVFQNNIVTMQDSADRPVVWRTNTRDTFTNSHNLYFNGNMSSASTSYGTLSLGTNYVNANPQITFSVSPFELSISSASPALGVGISTPYVTEDFYKNSLESPRSIGPLSLGSTP